MATATAVVMMMINSSSQQSTQPVNDRALDHRILTRPLRPNPPTTRMLPRGLLVASPLGELLCVAARQVPVAYIPLHASSPSPVQAATSAASATAAAAVASTARTATVSRQATLSDQEKILTVKERVRPPLARIAGLVGHRVIDEAM